MTRSPLKHVRAVVVRPICAADTNALVALYERLSSPMTLSRELAERLVRVDGLDKAAVVATDRERIVGCARYERLRGTTTAEVAVVVDETYQDDELGNQLREQLVDLARKNGITRITASSS